MTTCIKALIAWTLSVAFIFASIGAVLARNEDVIFFEDESLVKIDFTGDQLPDDQLQGETKVKWSSFVGLNNDGDESKSLSKPPYLPPDWDWDPLSEFFREVIPTSENGELATYEILEVSSRSTPSHPVTTSNPLKNEFRLLIGVMSPLLSSFRRHIIRSAYSRFPRDLDADVFFIQGDTPTWRERNAEKVFLTHYTAMQWENDTYHDIIYLDCEENLEKGKTYEYFKKVGLEFSNKYTHVMKTDDDSFVNIPGSLPLFVLFFLFPLSSSNICCSPCRSHSSTQRRTAFLLGYYMERR